ncbi:MAG: GDP-mannose 4,6-dehydratase [Pseudomonadota bacterium]|nr:GDP-mannose 4,6-dehydratase [Pseudomonadota bacterium]
MLVTGLNGFTGVHLSTVLTKAGFEVHGTIKADESADERHHVADLDDLGALRDVVRRVRPTHVVHLAAISLVSHDDVQEIYRTNIVGTRNLLSALANSDAARETLSAVLLASSANIYGNTDIEPIDEAEPAHPANDYAVSKLAMEHMARLWSARLPLTIVRPFNYTGVGQSLQFLIPKIVRAFAHRMPELEIGNIDVERDFSDVRDVVGAYRALLESSERGTFNICSGRAVSLREILRLCEEFTGHSLTLRVNPALVRANEVARLRGSNVRLRQLLPTWEPRPIRETVRWMIENSAISP